MRPQDSSTPTPTSMRRIVLLAGLALSVTSAHGQTTPQQGPRDTIPSDFLELADLRGSLGNEIATLQREIAQLQDSVRDADRWISTATASEALARRDSA